MSKHELFSSRWLRDTEYTSAGSAIVPNDAEYMKVQLVIDRFHARRSRVEVDNDIAVAVFADNNFVLGFTWNNEEPLADAEDLPWVRKQCRMLRGKRIRAKVKSKSLCVAACTVEFD